MAYADLEKRKKTRREYAKRRYHEDAATRERQIERAKRNQGINKDKYLDMLNEFRRDGCMYCSEKNPICLEAHHRDPAQKEFNISRSWVLKMASRIEVELSKCDCVCKNCHAKIHGGMIGT